MINEIFTSYLVALMQKIRMVRHCFVQTPCIHYKETVPYKQNEGIYVGVHSTVNNKLSPSVLLL